MRCFQNFILQHSNWNTETKALMRFRGSVFFCRRNKARCIWRNFVPLPLNWMGESHKQTPTMIIGQNFGIRLPKVPYLHWSISWFSDFWLLPITLLKCQVHHRLADRILFPETQFPVPKICVRLDCRLKSTGVEHDLQKKYASIGIKIGLVFW